jgi:hypothetical protein
MRPDQVKFGTGCNTKSRANHGEERIVVDLIDSFPEEAKAGYDQGGQNEWGLLPTNVCNDAREMLVHDLGGEDSQAFFKLPFSGHEAVTASSALSRAWLFSA